MGVPRLPFERDEKGKIGGGTSRDIGFVWNGKGMEDFLSERGVIVGRMGSDSPFTPLVPYL